MDRNIPDRGRRSIDRVELGVVYVLILVMYRAGSLGTDPARPGPTLGDPPQGQPRSSARVGSSKPGSADPGNFHMKRPGFWPDPTQTRPDPRFFRVRVEAADPTLLGPTRPDPALHITKI